MYKHKVDHDSVIKQMFNSFVLKLHNILFSYLFITNYYRYLELYFIQIFYWFVFYVNCRISVTNRGSIILDTLVLQKGFVSKYEFAI